jgi:hypothetical protein
MSFSVAQAVPKKCLRPRICVTFRDIYASVWRGIVSLSPNPKSGTLPTVGCPQLLIQNICSYPVYLDAVFSSRNLRTRHTVVAGTSRKRFLFNLRNVMFNFETICFLYDCC